jgi:predicted nuclease of predicted toxin-antitoxin system
LTRELLVDMPLSPALAAWLRDQGHDTIHAVEIGLSRASDADIVAFAKEERRTIVTADLDYPRLLALARLTDPSLILFREGDWSDADVIARMGEILRLLTAADIAQSIIVVDRDRVRRRRLPISK